MKRPTDYLSLYVPTDRPDLQNKINAFLEQMRREDKDLDYDHWSPTPFEDLDLEDDI